MKILTRNEIDKGILNKIKKDAVFIYPTDTIYGIGCNAEEIKSVKRICEIKERYNKPFSVIAPSKDWILKNCEINNLSKRWIDKLPGAYTLILNLKNKKCVAKNVNNNSDTLGIRIPDHWFSEIVYKLDIPIVTTSVNKSDNKFMTCLEDLDTNIKENIDFIIYEGKKEGNPSRIIEITKEKVVIIER